MKILSLEIKINKKIKYIVEIIIDLRINNRKNDSRTKLKNYLQYRIKFTNYDIDKHS